MKLLEALQKYIDDKEECIIYTKRDTAVYARIIEVCDDFIRLDENDSESLMFINEISRIRTYPKNEKGKKKTIFT